MGSPADPTLSLPNAIFKKFSPSITSEPQPVKKTDKSFMKGMCYPNKSTFCSLICKFILNNDKEEL